MQAEWQYMLVERMEPPTQTSGGLFLPSNEMVGAEGGRERDASAHDLGGNGIGEKPIHKPCHNILTMRRYMMDRTRCTWCAW